MGQCRSVAATPGTTRYRYTDQSPAVGVNDYQLILRSSDTVSGHSAVRQVHINAPQHIALFPNPARDQLMLMTDPVITGTVRLYTEDGRLVRQQYMNGTQLNISLVGLLTGTYHVVILKTDGTTYERHIFHIQ